MYGHLSPDLNGSFSTYLPSPNDSMDKLAEVSSADNYKTELCRTWVANNYCPYNEKCRFAHGKKELHDKIIVGRFYKQKQCKSFYTTGTCKYGSRCHFRHEQRRLEEIERTFFGLQLLRMREGFSNRKRLNVFQNITAIRPTFTKNDLIKFSPQHFLLMRRAILKTLKFY